MAGIREIRKKVASISSTRKITSAMEMVAASKMRRSQQRMRDARPYAERILAVVGHLVSATPQYRPYLARTREPNRCAWILIGTDKGLCGGLNHNLFRRFLTHWQQRLDQRPEMQSSAVAFGLKAEALCRRLGLPFAGIGKLGEREVPTAAILGALKPLLEKFRNAELDRIYLARNRFVSTITQEPEILQLAPLKPPETDPDPHAKHLPWDYIYEPAPEELLDRLLERYVEATVHEAIIENVACEQAAKMLAMKNATDNAGELIEELKLEYNNARQASITAELADIIGGAEAV